MRESSRTLSSMHSSPADPVFLGCSGWAYTSWKPGFYPAKTPSKQFLTYYASQLNSVEVNYTFRQLPGPSMVENWLGSVQAGFQFSFKAPQSLTHFKRLRDCAEVVHAFYESLARFRDAGRMGVILFQLPPNFKADRERLAAFLKYASVKDQRIAFEFRHESWFGEDTFSTLRDHNAALCVAASDDLETPDIQTANFFCYRLRESEYSPKRLKQIAEDFKTRAAAGQVYAYFKHEEEPSGPQRAREVLEMVRGL